MGCPLLTRFNLNGRERQRSDKHRGITEYSNARAPSWSFIYIRRQSLHKEGNEGETHRGTSP